MAGESVDVLTAVAQKRHDILAAGGRPERVILSPEAFAALLAETDGPFIQSHYYDKKIMGLPYTVEHGRAAVTVVSREHDMRRAYHEALRPTVPPPWLDEEERD